METPFSDNPSILPWENHAASWDEQMGDNGNDYFSALELPVLKRLISPQPGNRALDLATGNGLVARWLAHEGALVFATDGSRAMIERARARTLTWCQQGRLSEDRVSFHVLDVTDRSSWEQFISRTCQTVSSYAINLPIWESTPLMRLGLVRNTGGWIWHSNNEHGLNGHSRSRASSGINKTSVTVRWLVSVVSLYTVMIFHMAEFSTISFVATLLHPLFFTSGADRQIVVREDSVTGERHIDQSLILRRYLKVPPARQLLFSGDLGSESPVWKLHFPLFLVKDHSFTWTKTSSASTAHYTSSWHPFSVQDWLLTH